ncbi:MAG TPA: hypothetical protein VGH03_19380 [Caulobacteraceae bacterium]|jgi:hypothetical protein
MSLQYNTGATAPSLTGPSGVLAGLIGALPFGPDTSGEFTLSLEGLAVQRVDGTSVALDADRDVLLNVTALVLPGVDPGVVWIPVPLDAIRRGDIIMGAGVDPAPLFVLDVEDAAHLVCLDPAAGELVTYTPPINPLLNGYAVAFSLFDLLLRGPGRRRFGDGDGDGDRDGDGGRRLGRLTELLPLVLLLSQGGGLSGAAPGSPAPTPTTNPLLALALLGGEGLGEGDGRGRWGGEGPLGMLLPLLLLGGLGGPTTGSASPTSAPPTTTSALTPLLLILALGGGLGRLFGGEDAEGEDEEGGGRRRMILAVLLLSLLSGQTPGATPAGGLSPLLLMALFGGDLLGGGRDGEGRGFGEGGQLEALLPLLLLGGLAPGAGAAPTTPGVSPTPTQPAAPAPGSSALGSSALSLIVLAMASRRWRRRGEEDEDVEEVEAEETEIETPAASHAARQPSAAARRRPSSSGEPDQGAQSRRPDGDEPTEV